MKILNNESESHKYNPVMWFNSSEEAENGAIEYVLKNLIKI